MPTSLTPWEDISSSKTFQGYTPEQQETVRKNFDTESAPKPLSPEDHKAFVDYHGVTPEQQKLFDVLPDPEGMTSAEPEVQPERTVGGTLKDIGVTAGKGVIGLGESVVGLADIPTGGRVGKALEDTIGYDPKSSKEFLSQFYSPAQKFAKKKVSEAEGFTDTFLESLAHPSTIVEAVGESLPQLVGGGAVARIIGKGAKVAPWVAGAMGEGAMSAGSSAEAVRQETDTGLLTAKQSAMAGASGAFTGAINLVGGRIAQKLGFADINTMLAGGKTSPGVLQKNVVGRIVAGGISEGVFEEMPQSMQEQMWQNAALDKPLFEGVPEAMAQGVLAGTAMGGGANIISGTGAQGASVDPQAAVDFRYGETVQPDAKPLTQVEKIEKQSLAYRQLSNKPASELSSEEQAFMTAYKNYQPAAPETPDREVAQEVTPFQPSVPATTEAELQSLYDNLSDVQDIDKDAQASAEVFGGLAEELLTPEGQPYQNQEELEKRIELLDNPADYNVVKTEDGFIGIKKASVGTAPRTFTDEQRVAELGQDGQADQVVPMGELENQMDAVDQQLEALSTQIATTTDSNEQAALQQEASALYTQKDELQTQWQAQDQAADTLPEAGAETAGTGPEFQTGTDQQIGTQLALPEIESMFPQQEVIQAADGTINVKFKNGKGVTIKSMQDAGQGFIKMAIETGQMSEQGKILGVTVANEILFDANYADNKTMWHENKHVLDNLGMITRADDSLLNKEFNKLRKAGKLDFALSTHEDAKQRMVENRANMFAQIMVDRAAYRDKPLGKTIQKVMDFFQKMFALGNQSVAGLAQEVESGRLYERQVAGETIQTTVPQAEVAANQWYSTLENAVTGFQQKQATPDQWKGMIKNFPGIKQEELEWVGVNEWLDAQQGKVSRENLVNFVKQNNIQVEEVVKSKGQDLIPDLNDALKPFGYEYTNDMDGSWYLLDSDTGEAVEVEDTSENVQAIINDVSNYGKQDETKYGSENLPGGKHYKEILITAPNKGKSREYKSGHWDESNVLAHVRFNERVDADGNKVLFLEEVQSDWHQAGRKEGYGQDGMPDAPFKKSWPMLAMKRMVRHAAENGFDKIAWTTGQQQADRYGLSGQIDYLTYSVMDAGSNQYKIQEANYDGWGSDDKVLTFDQIKEKYGEEIANKIKDSEGDEVTYDGASYRNLDVDIHVPHKGMNDFYDKILPSMINKEFNRGKWGKAKTEIINIGEKDASGDEYSIYLDGKEFLTYDSEESARKDLVDMKEKNPDYNWTLEPRPDIKANNVLSLPITARMKAKALREGMPQFQTTEDQGKTTTTLHDTLIQAKQDTGLIGQLAEFMSQFIPESKLDIPVIIDPTARSANYNRNKGITIKDPSQLKTSLHEIVHGVTVREMEANKDIKAKVTSLMDIVEREAVRAAHLTPKQMQDIKSAGGSKAFKNKFPLGSEIDKVGHLAYSLLNEREFLAQAFSSLQVQGFMQSINIKGKEQGQFKTLWDKFIGMVMNSLGIPKTHKTAFGEALKLTAELAQANIEKTDQGIAADMDIDFGSLIRDVDDRDVSFEALEQPEQKISQAQYDRSFKQKNNLIQDIMQTAKIRGHEMTLLADKLTGSISTRLANANPMLRDKMRKLDFDTSQNIKNALHVALPLLKQAKKMSPADKHAWDLARKSSDEGKIQQLAQRYDMVEDQEKLRDVLNNIRKEAKDVGYDVGFVEEYWPRIIKDQEGFLQATQGISERPEFTDAIKAKADKMGISVEELNAKFPEVKADVISGMILGRGDGIGGPGNIQGRKFDVIPENLEKFYMDSDAALMQYIYSMTKKIEARKFFGKLPPKIQKHKNSIAKAQAELSRIDNQMAPDNPELAATMEDRITDLNERLDMHNEALEKYKEQRDYTENIGAYIDELMIKGELHKKDERVVRDILEARFKEHGTTGVVNAYKNLAYIDVMGSLISAMTQIGDLAWAAYVGKAWTPKGFSNTVKNVINATLNKSKVTKEDLGIERIAQEFADGTTLGKAVSNVFKVVGLTKMDSIGKETLINNALMNYQEQIKTPEGMAALKKKIRPTYGKETDQVIQDLASDTHSDNVKLLLYSRLLDFQPAALSEMSEGYLKGGNGRVFYMLKTYTLKQMDVFRNEVVHELKSKDPERIKAGLGNMVKLLSMLTLANAGADELKDFVLGKKVKFSDNVIENFLSIGGASRYMRMQVTREGVGSALAQKILPPFKFINSASSDIGEVSATGDVEKGLRSLESVPVIGKLAYWHFGRGDENKKSVGEKDFSKANKRFRKFNKQLEKATDKRLFLQANSEEFKQMKLHKNFQAVLTKNKTEINKLEKLEQTPNVVKRIGQLRNQREMFYERYFDAADNLAG